MSEKAQLEKESMAKKTDGPKASCAEKRIKKSATEKCQIRNKCQKTVVSKECSDAKRFL